MQNLKFISVTGADTIRTVASLAKEIWNEYYPSIIGQPQVTHMLQEFQTSAAIKKQIHDDGYLYYLLNQSNTYVGYFAVVPKNDDRELFISKFYVCADYRGRGIGSFTIQYIEKLAIDMHFEKIALMVHKTNNRAIRAYQSMGFKNIGSRVTDIGSGFVMDDYVMERAIAL
jgi:diamine N-acetyltransferase